MYKIYQVGNETLNDIAAKFNTTIEALEKLNGIQSVIPGSYIIIPNTESSDYTTYIVKRGDNLYAIARTYQVDYSTLLKINGLDENDYIYPDQKIMIPNSKIYVTNEQEKISDILNNLNIKFDDIKNLEELYLVKDQIIKF